jgi:hypothetical protein
MPLKGTFSNIFIAHEKRNYTWKKEFKNCNSRKWICQVGNSLAIRDERKRLSKPASR